jgi:hypothetical protein
MNEEVSKELKRLREDCTYSSKGHYNAATIWTISHWVFGLATVVLSGVSTTLKGSDYLMYFTLFATITAGVVTFLNPSQKAAAHKASGADFQGLKDQSRIFMNMEAPAMEESHVVTAIKVLQEKKKDFNQRSPSIPPPAFWWARKGIESGETEYMVDR